ncbi:MAG: ABC transporter ATP-binding protein/permease [Firmicutes bacterium]|nr:ABC transporter ATP-binding protein/permease [Bacillota bacterium]
MKKMFKFLKPYWFQVFIIFILVSITSMGTLLLPDYMRIIIGQGITAEYQSLDPISGEYIVVEECDVLENPDTCKIIQKSDFGIIAKYGVIMIGVTLVSSVAAIILMYVSSNVASNTGKDIRRDLYKKINQFSMAEAEQFGTSSLITRSTNDVVQIQNFLIMGLRMFLRIPIFFIGGIIMSVRISKELTGVLILGVPALIILIVVTFILVLPLFKALQKKVDKLTLVTRESINGVRVIRSFGQGEKEVKRFQNANADLTSTTLKSGKIMSMLNPAVNLIFNFVILGILYLAFTFVSTGTFGDYQSLANVSAVIQYSTQIMFSLLMLTMTFIMYPRAEVSGKRILEVLEKEIVIKDEGNPIYDDLDITGKIQFNDVCFKYADAEKNVLDHISFEANPGETIAIIGSTGSGKSTIINLLPRFFDVTCGSVTIDDINVSDFTLHKLRSIIGFVPQTATLFSGTIKENIGYGKEDATFEDIQYAANIGQASEFIEEMDLKYDSVVEQGGVNFSGGQKQRISISRALIRKPKIYIFDDSFSALDFKTDAALRKALKKETTDATVIIIAQRIGTIMDADKILVIQEGTIVGMGNHRELLKTCEVYKEIALSQLSEEELA